MKSVCYIVLAYVWVSHVLWMHHLNWMPDSTCRLMLDTRLQGCVVCNPYNTLVLISSATCHIQQLMIPFRTYLYSCTHCQVDTMFLCWHICEYWNSKTVQYRIIIVVTNNIIKKNIHVKITVNNLPLSNYPNKQSYMFSCNGCINLKGTYGVMAMLGSIRIHNIWWYYPAWIGVSTQKGFVAYPTWIGVST